MAQRPTADFNIDPNITSGTDLANILNRFQDAIDSGNSGASRPAYLAAGGLWVREGDPMRLYLYDGTTDRELYNTTDGIVGGIPDGAVDGQITTWNSLITEWSPNDAVVVGAAGDVGIGTLSPISNGGYGELTLNGRSGGQVHFANDDVETVRLSSWTGSLTLSSSNEFRFNAGGFTSSEEVVRIDATGRVGIGGTPSRSAEEIAKEAKNTLSRWKSTFDDRLKAEPKADKKAVTLEITGNEFDTFPSEKALTDKLTERNIGGGDAKLQVIGDGYFTGDVYANGSPLTRATDLIETLSTLREATRDETTLEGLRDALSDAIGGLIQKFEAQISTTES